MTVRFKKANPCPICGGGDDMPRGKGQRCSGYLSSDGRFVYCTREEHAGQARAEDTEPLSYRHILEGECRCGVTHAPAGADESEIAYDYVDEAGALLYQVVRKPGKKFLQRRPDGHGDWIWNLGDTRRVLYRLPAVLEAAAVGETVYVVEGEKDVHAIERAGAVATCNSGGASKPPAATKWRPEYSASLAGANVVIVADRDEAGIAHARSIAESLNGSKPRIVQAAAGLKDAHDHLSAGKTLDELEPVIDTPGTGDIDWGPAPTAERASDHRTVDGWSFVTASSDTVAAVWGEGDEVAQASGEPLMIVGPDGVGKTAIGQQLALRRLTGGTLLGLPVAKASGKVLYLAADRPPQAARSMRRMVRPDDEETLRDRLIVHRGPPPFDLVKDPVWTLRNWIESLGATDIIIDSLKDLANELSKDEVGGAINRSFQEAAAAGIEIVALHHQRKQQPGAPPPRRLADVYGSRWLTAGCGSVICLWGEPGDLVVSFKHLKQPVEEIGPFNVLHDHVHGHTTVHDHTDLEQLLSNTLLGLTCKDAARLIFTKDEPKPNDIEKARRKLEGLVGRNHAERRDDQDGLARYFTRAAA